MHTFPAVCAPLAVSDIALHHHVAIHLLNMKSQFKMWMYKRRTCVEKQRERGREREGERVERKERGRESERRRHRKREGHVQFI